MKVGNKKMRQASYWLIFIFAAVSMTFKICEVSANETLKILIQNPECAQYSYLVTNGYLFEI